MSRPHSDWLFHTLRGLSLLVIGWAYGAFYGLSGLGLHGIFLPTGMMLLGFSEVRSSTAAWIITSCACVGAVMVLSSLLAFHPMIFALWGAYVFAVMTVGALVPRRWVPQLRLYFALLLIAVGAGMVWQAYPTLAEGVFRAQDVKIVPPARDEWFRVLLVGLASGGVGGAVGLGGGYVMVPVLVLMGISPHVVLWLCLWLMFPAAPILSMIGARRSSISWSQEGWLGAGAFLGGVAGATWALSFSRGMLTLCFGVALMVVALVIWRLVVLVGKATSVGGD